MKRSIRPLLLSAILAIALVGGGALVLKILEDRSVADRRRSATALAAQHAYSLQQELDRGLSASLTLARMVGPHDDAPDFQAVAEVVRRVHGGHGVLMLAPEGIVRRASPLDGSAETVGWNLLADPALRSAALDAVERRTLHVVGPTKLPLGGLGMVSLQPILKKPAGNAEQFWGFAVAAFRMEDLGDAARLSTLGEAGWIWRLIRTGSVPGGVPYLRSGPGAPVDPVRVEIEVPGGSWTFEMAPAEGWSGGLHLMAELAVVGLLGLLIGLLTFLLADRGFRLRQALRFREQAEQRYELAAACASDGLWEWDLVSDRIHFAQRWRTMLGLGNEGAPDHPNAWFKRVHPDDVDRLRAAIDAHVEGQTEMLECEHRMQHAEGAYRWMLSRAVAVRDSAGKVLRLGGSTTDITARKLAEERLAHDALHDAFTGLPNRSLFTDRLIHLIARAKRRRDTRFAVLLCGLDNFDLVTDSLGPTQGDQLLISIARMLETCVRPADTVARHGSHEFAILLDEIRDVSDATRVAERIQEAFKTPFRAGQQEIFISASIGIAVSATGYNLPEDMLRDAEIALNRAQAQGKGKQQIFDQAMHAHAVNRLELETDLRRAVEREEFVVFYQPIMSMRTGHIEGFEALVRWQHPAKGMVSPGAFIPVAEETGLIVPIGDFVLRQACWQTRAWHARFRQDPPLTIAVNLSMKQFSEKDLPAQIRRILRQTRFNPASLKLEITESAIMDQVETTIEMLTELRKLDVKLYVDDFGTGYSSLSYLHRFPIDALKVDRSFVSRMTADSEELEIVRTIHQLASTLELKVVAEGIETGDQLALLRELDCDYGQGFFFSRPIPAEEATELLARRPRW